MTSSDRLRRSGSDRMLFGVSGGLGRYFDVDPVFVRLGWVVLCFVTFGLAILLYVALGLIMPKDSSAVFSEADSNEADTARLGPDEATEVSPATERLPGRRRGLFALALIVIGVLALLANLGIFSWGVMWPLALIGLGAATLASRKSFSR